MGGAGRTGRKSGAYSLDRDSDAGDQPALLASGGVLVDHALGRSLVDPLDRLTESFGLTIATGSGDGRLLPGAELRADSPVAKPTLLVLPISLDLALDVGHKKPHVSGTTSFALPNRFTIGRNSQ